MQFTYASGRRVKRIFCGNIGNEADLQKFVQEVRMEMDTNQLRLKPEILFVELWQDNVKAKVFRKAQ